MFLSRGWMLWMFALNFGVVFKAILTWPLSLLSICHIRKVFRCRSPCSPSTDGLCLVASDWSISIVATSFPWEEERGPWERVFDPRCSHRRSATSAGISFQYSGSIADHVQDQLRRTFKQKTSNVVSYVLWSFCALCKLIPIDLFGCFSGKLKLQKTMELIYQTRGRVFPPISKHREVGWKNEAQPSFFNQLRGVWK